MKIITLNTWGGRAGKENLLNFFEKYKNETDIFCLQEVWSHAYKDLGGRTAGGVVLDYSKIMVNGVREISESLSEFVPFFHPHVADNYGLLMFVKKKYTVISEGEIFVYKERGYVSDADAGNHARNIQYVQLEISGNPLTIINFHGLWTGKGKTDSEDRINQSKKILEFIKTLSGDVVLCGDFNLLPDTESIKIIEASGLRNLIKEYGITSTRTSYYTKAEKHADYIFTTKEMEVKDFKALPEEVSDHSALFTELYSSVIE